MARHPELTSRRPQTLSRTRNAAASDDIHRLFGTMAKLIIELKLTRAQVFNVDEAAFQRGDGGRGVIALRGSRNVWTLAPTTNFHLTIVACGSAAGLVIPPAFILPSKTARLNILDGCVVPGAAVTTTASGFMNEMLFERWLRFFVDAFPADVPQPLLLVVDGRSSHYSSAIAATATALGTLLVCLPANATHLLHPLDVAVFSPFKAKLRRLINEFVEEDESGGYSIEKAAALRLACMAWKQCRFSRNIAAGFSSCGLFSLSLTKMHQRLQHYTSNGTPKDARMAAWLQAEQAVRSQVLVLPATTVECRKRKTAPVAGRLLTAKLLGDMASQDKKTSGKKRRPKGAVERAGGLLEAVV